MILCFRFLHLCLNITQNRNLSTVLSALTSLEPKGKDIYSPLRFTFVFAVNRPFSAYIRIQNHISLTWVFQADLGLPFGITSSHLTWARDQLYTDVKLRFSASFLAERLDVQQGLPRGWFHVIYSENHLANGRLTTRLSYRNKNESWGGGWRIQTPSQHTHTDVIEWERFYWISTAKLKHASVDLDKTGGVFVYEIHSVFKPRGVGGRWSGAMNEGEK